VPNGDGAVRGLLFTDLEGSTAHLRVLGEKYASVLARHHEIIRAAIAAHGGVEAGSEGDSFAVVFPDAGAAVDAAVDAQRALTAEPWPDTPWRVRMAVHAGAVEMSSAGAVGIALHEAARVRAVAHGGQIVVSDAAARDVVPGAGIVLRDLGVHAIRDFATDVRVRQVVADGLPSDFPPLRTMAARAVPPARTPLVGRESELEELLDLVSSTRIVTVTGAGGSGKTRLAYETARRADVEAVAVAELAGLRDPTQVRAEVANAVGARQPDAVTEAIGAADLLLVIDNCEHVIDEVAMLVSELVDRCPGLTVVATSREPLAVAGELVWQVPTLEPDDAIALFRTRAAVDVDADLAAAACERLGWMPLAIELAAARARSTPITELLTRLDDQLGVLTTGVRDVPRQKTLRATLDWSHELLTVDEQIAFRRLGVFAGGFTLDAAERVASRDDVNVLDALDGLVLKSLVQPSATRDRYTLLEPIRQYAVERLVEAGEDDDVHRGHIRWVERLVQQANRELFLDQRRWTAILDAERDNVGAAVEWALGHGVASAAATIISNLAWYWFTSGRSDAYVLVPRALQSADDLDELDRAKLLLAAGIVYIDDRTDPRPMEWLRAAEATFRARGNERALGSALFWLARAAGTRYDFDGAERAFDESIEIHERLGDLFGWGWSYLWKGVIARFRGDPEGAEQVLHDVIERAGDIPHVVAGALGELAHLAELRGALDEADRYAAEVIEVYEQLGDRWQLAIATSSRAGYALDVDPPRAAAYTIEAMKLFLEVRDAVDLGHCFPGVAHLLVRAGRREQAATLLAGHDDWLTDADVDAWMRSLRDKFASLKALLDDPALHAERERGRRMSVYEAADAAIAWLAQAYPASASISV